MRLFHYTVGSKLAPIAASGYLNPSAVPARCPHERGILWFSANPNWEPTATKPIQLPGWPLPIRSLDLLHQTVGLFRLVWAADTHEPATCPPRWRLDRFPAITSMAGVSGPERVAMAQSGIKMGAAPSDWWGRLDPLEIDELWLEERDREGNWQQVDYEEAMARYADLGLNVRSAVAA